MAINTILFDFKDCNNDKLDSGLGIKEEVEETFSHFFPELSLCYMINNGPAGIFILWEDPNGCIVTVRKFSKLNLISARIEQYVDIEDSPLLTLKEIRYIEKRLKEKLNCASSNSYPPLKRAEDFNRYLVSMDERICEYDLGELLHEVKSQYQKIQIFSSRTFGRMLVINDIPNMSDSDTIYTSTLMQQETELYEGKEILILGGGNGALLYQLLTENPKFVTMIEIDQCIIDTCKIFLRSLCESSLDKMKGDNYEIIVDEFTTHLDAYMVQNRKFDYVFADLTKIPMSISPLGDHWDFIRSIHTKSLNVLKPKGKFMTSCTSVACPVQISIYEETLCNLDIPISYTKDNAFVPSFLEKWTFYQITRDEE